MNDREKTKEQLIEELIESKAILQAIVESLPFDFFAIGPDGRYMVQNAASKKHWGEAIGKRPEDVAGSETTLAIWLENNRRAFAGQRVEEEVELTINGEKRFCNNVIAPIRENDHIRGILGVNIDVTERKRAEEALRKARDELEEKVHDRTAELVKANEELRAIYDQVADGIIIADAETANPVRTNAAYCRMMGYSEEEARTLSPERVHPPEILPLVWEHLETVKRGLVARIDNLPFVHRDGSIFYADVVSSPIRYNQRPCWISFFHDVTERKRAADELQKEHRALKHLLQSSDHERQLIAYEIHDGLAQQLAGAIMQFQTYAHLKDAKPRLAARAYDAAMTMLHQGHFEARRLISGVRPPILDESGVVAAVAHLVGEQRLQNGPTIELLNEVEFNRLAPILENAVYRIVQEGLANACKHSRSQRLRVELVQHGDRLRIRIRDWGVGFDPAGIEEGRFGLYGIRQRARLLGGNATIESAPGEGACITVELPLVLEE
jgi:PAS domain S-box-containing protein